MTPSLGAAMPKVRCEESYMDTDGIRKRCSEEALCARCIKCYAHCSCSPERTLAGIGHPPGWLTADLSFIEDLSGGRFETERDAPSTIRWDGRSLVCESGGTIRLIRSTSDLLTKPWYGEPDRMWQKVASVRRRIMRDFISMVEDGQVALSQAPSEDRENAVVFDVPIPAHGRPRQLPNASRVIAPAVGWWVGWVADISRGKGPRKLVTHIYSPEDGYTWPTPIPCPTGPSSGIAPSYQVVRGACDRYSGLLVPAYRPSEIERPVYVQLRDLDSYPGSVLFYDLPALIRRERQGAEYHVAGESSGVSLIWGAGQEYRGAFRTHEVPVLREGTAGGHLPYVPPRSTVAWVVRTAGILAGSSGDRCVGVRRLAEAASVGPVDVLCSLAVAEYANVLYEGYGCYSRLGQARHTGTPGILKLAPVAVGELVGTLLQIGQGNSYTLATSGDRVCVSENHIHRCKHGSAAGCAPVAGRGLVNGHR